MQVIMPCILLEKMIYEPFTMLCDNNHSWGGFEKYDDTDYKKYFTFSFSEFKEIGIF